MVDARDQDHFEGAGLVRLVSWATAAAFALALAALACLSPAGSQRATAALAALGGGKEPRQAVQIASRQQIEIENERRSLNEALRLLATDRDRLMTRVGSIERNLDDITGSIKSQTAARRMPTTNAQEPPPKLETPPVVASDAPRTKPAGLPDWLANVPEPWPSPSYAAEFAPGPPSDFLAKPIRVTAIPAIPPQPATESPVVPARTEFGIDVGSGSNLEEVRFLWNATKAQHGKLLGNLRPVMVRGKDAAGKPDYRLVIGPLASAGAAAKLCATLGSSEVVCSTKPYQGERFTP
jgi:hypothetical protein